MKRRDWILIGCLLAIALAACLPSLSGWRAGDSVHIRVDGRLVETLPLAANRRYAGQGALGPFEVELSGSGARMLSSTCADALCVRQGMIQSAGQSIVCLPNRVSIALTLADDDGLDAVAY